MYAEYLSWLWRLSIVFSMTEASGGNEALHKIAVTRMRYSNGGFSFYILFLIARSNRFIGKTSGGMPRVLFQILVKLFYAVHDRRCHVVMSVIRIQTDVLTAC